MADETEPTDLSMFELPFRLERTRGTGAHHIVATTGNGPWTLAANLDEDDGLMVVGILNAALAIRNAGQASFMQAPMLAGMRADAPKLALLAVLLSAGSAYTIPAAALDEADRLFDLDVQVVDGAFIFQPVKKEPQ